MEVAPRGEEDFRSGFGRRPAPSVCVSSLWVEPHRRPEQAEITAKRGSRLVLVSKTKHAAATRADRQRMRSQLGSLVSLRVSALTEKRYVVAYCKLSKFAQETHRVPINAFFALDELCAAYVEA